MFNEHFEHFRTAAERFQISLSLSVSLSIYLCKKCISISLYCSLKLNWLNSAVAVPSAENVNRCKTDKYQLWMAEQREGREVGNLSVPHVPLLLFRTSLGTLAVASGTCPGSAKFVLISVPTEMHPHWLAQELSLAKQALSP